LILNLKKNLIIFNIFSNLYSLQASLLFGNDPDEPVQRAGTLELRGAHPAELADGDRGELQRAEQLPQFDARGGRPPGDRAFPGLGQAETAARSTGRGRRPRRSRRQRRHPLHPKQPLRLRLDPPLDP
jgi:hypothetical protein